MAKAKIYLYKEGNECESITGGWIGSKALTNYGGTGTGSKEFDKIIVTGGSSATYGFYTNNQFSNLSKAYIDYSSNGKSFGSFGINNNKMPFSSSSYLKVIDFATTDSITPRQVIELDLNYVSSLYHFCITAGGFSPLFVYNVYFNTSENVLTIHSQTNDNIIFSANDLGLVTISKIDVLVNNVISKTYTDEYSNLSYTIDKSLYTIGNNNIEIRVTYSQGDDITETASEYLTYKYDVSQLPLETPLIDTVERVKLLTNSKQNEKNMLSSILTSKNVEVSEEDKMSDLINKVNELGDVPPPPLYLYKDGDECVDVTGGIEILFKWEVANYGNNSFGNKYSNYIRLEANGVNNQESGIGAYTTNKIDLTEYSKLCFEYLSENFTHSYGVMFSASNDKPTSCYKGDNKVAYVFETKNPTNEITTLTIDISRITGSYYISGVARASGATTCNADLNIYKIWLEK